MRSNAGVNAFLNMLGDYLQVAVAKGLSVLLYRNRPWNLWDLQSHLSEELPNRYQ